MSAIDLPPATRTAGRREIKKDIGNSVTVWQSRRIRWGCTGVGASEHQWVDGNGGMAGKSRQLSRFRGKTEQKYISDKGLESLPGMASPFCARHSTRYDTAISHRRAWTPRRFETAHETARHAACRRAASSRDARTNEVLALRYESGAYGTTLGVTTLSTTMRTVCLGARRWLRKQRASCRSGRQLQKPTTMTVQGKCP